MQGFFKGFMLILSLFLIWWGFLGIFWFGVAWTLVLAILFIFIGSFSLFTLLKEF